MGSVFWPVVAVIGLLCLWSIRAQMRRLVRRLDITLQVINHLLAAKPGGAADPPRSARP
jgi:hypothetical protein